MNPSPSVLFIDNFDSFSFNLVDDFKKRGCDVHVWRNDISAFHAMTLALELPPPALIVLSPGPSAPAEAGCCIELVRLNNGQIPLFGVCLGHQAIIEAYGGKVGYAGEVVHGKASSIEHQGQEIFSGLESPMQAARYHSLAAVETPPELEVIAKCNNIVMAVHHRSLPIVGVQFHPESILTPQGTTLIDQVLEWAMQKDPRRT
jgi:anthranilate synthase/aminodeoxychorismate synthase-like glutamine amidotransferase